VILRFVVTSGAVRKAISLPFEKPTVLFPHA